MSIFYFSASTAMMRRDGQAELNTFAEGQAFDMGGTLPQPRHLPEG
jgi:hypothetical protein